MNEIIIVIGLFLLGVALGAAEVFIPSAGVLAMLSIASFVASIVFAFAVSAIWGIVTLFAAPAVMVVVVAKGFKYLPKTFIGKRMILPSKQVGAPSKGSTGYLAPPNGGSPTPDDPEQLTGRQGLARTELRPSGSAQIGDRRYNVVSVGEFIAQGAAIRVVEVNGNRIVVESVK